MECPMPTPKLDLKWTPLVVLMQISSAVRRRVRKVLPSWARRFTNSHDYWLRRYRLGGDSGVGSGGASAAYKADYLNTFVMQHGISSMIDLGCGDGRNAVLLSVPSYLGLDISPRAVALARARCSGQHKRFAVLGTEVPTPADLAISMDVVYHLIEDDVLEGHLSLLSQIATRYILIYGTDHDAVGAPHVRHRQISNRFLALNAGWSLAHREPNRLYGADWRTNPHFCVFERKN